MDFNSGQILLSALGFVPDGMLACNGQSVPIASYGQLFGQIGTTYGGDGTSSFGVPNLAPVNPAKGRSLPWLISPFGAPYSSGMEALLGEIRALPLAPPAGSTLASTWVPCDGRLLDVGKWQALFSLLGSKFGGDGIRNFALPNLAPLAATNGPPLAYWICVSGMFPPLNRGTTFDTYLATVLSLPYDVELVGEIGGLLNCGGQTLEVDYWPALFSLLRTAFGGDGTTTFLLPDRPPVQDIAYVMVSDGLYPPRS